MTTALQGSFVALPTPFRNGQIDWASFENLARWQIESGTRGLVPCGTTGETPALTHEEQISLVKKTIEIAAGRALVMAGCGANGTAKTIKLAQEIAALGPDALLVVTPYYNRPSQHGLLEHYQAVAKSVKTPICIYNVPSRTGCNIEPDTVLALAKSCPSIVAIKEASGSLDQASFIVREAPSGFSVLSGEDSLNLPLLAVGAVGVVSVLANVAPRGVADMISAWNEGNADKARRLHLKLWPLSRALFVETNPIPVKWALHRLGKFASPELRLPLVTLTPDNAVKLERALAGAGLLEPAAA
ncbi:MAG: 4-hydroxy-tetrahydrodipicolinate synthase [Elusimicrobiota bacterium]